MVLHRLDLGLRTKVASSGGTANSIRVAGLPLVAEATCAETIGIG